MEIYFKFSSDNVKLLFFEQILLSEIYYYNFMPVDSAKHLICWLQLFLIKTKLLYLLLIKTMKF